MVNFFGGLCFVLIYGVIILVSMQGWIPQKVAFFPTIPLASYFGLNLSAVGVLMVYLINAVFYAFLGLFVSEMVRK